MHGMKVLLHVVLSKSEGSQKWLARTEYVHRVAGTLDVCILGQDSHGQLK
jgi:hypothetical protein